MLGGFAIYRELEWMKLISSNIPESLQKGDDNKVFSGSDSGMTPEYQRLQAEASEVQNQINRIRVPVTDVCLLSPPLQTYRRSKC